MTVPTLAEIEAAILGPDDHPAVLADIHGTVDLDRALVDLGLDGDDARAEVPAIVEDELLGARVVVFRARGIAVAEPATEGRLAATLARSGEGVIGRYVEVDAGSIDERVAERAAMAGFTLGRPGVGPFGREVLAAARTIGSRSLLLVERRSLPSPS